MIVCPASRLQMGLELIGQMNSRLQLRRTKRFDQIIGGGNFPAAPQGVAIPQAGAENDGAGMKQSQSARHLDAIHFRHLNIHDDEIGAGSLDHLQGFLATAGDFNLIVAKSAQAGYDHVRHRRVVVHDHDFFWAIMPVGCL